MSGLEFRTKKSERTFEALLETATKLFREKGYHASTMRDISRESGLGLGALYYYFRSKEELVLLFYERINAQVLGEFRELERPGALPEALAAFLRLKLERLTPYRDLLRVVIKEAVDPDSPLSPLNPSSAGTLAASVGMFREMVEDSRTARGEEAREMARGLWMMHMGILTYWLHDRSEGYTATGRAIDTLAALVRWSGRAARIPGFGGLRKQMLSLVSGLVREDPREGH